MQRRDRDLRAPQIDAEHLHELGTPVAAAESSSTVTSLANGGSIEAGTRGSGFASGPKAAATAPAFDCPETRNTTLFPLPRMGSVIDTRGTNGSRPASCTPTTSRSRTESDG